MSEPLIDATLTVGLTGAEAVALASGTPGAALVSANDKLYDALAALARGQREADRQAEAGVVIG